MKKIWLILSILCSFTFFGCMAWGLADMEFGPVDNKNGTVYVPTQKLTWAKCSQANLGGSNGYNMTTNSCISSKIVFQYCSVADHSCDDGTTLNGNGSSETWITCNVMNATPGFAGRTNWRAPTQSELWALSDVYAMHTELFPDAGNGKDVYNSSSSYNLTNFWNVNNFGKGGIQDNSGSKLNRNYVRCVSTGK